MSSDVIDAIRSRRSVRRYTERAVTDDEIRAVVEAATCAPSGANLQMWRFLAIRSRAKLAAMLAAVESRIEQVRSGITNERARRHFEGYVAHFGHFAKAPVVVCILAKPYDSIFTRIASRYAPGVPGLGAAKLVDVATMSVSAAVENMLLAAHSMGLGSCWMTGPAVAQEELERILGVGEPWHLMSLVTLGEAAHAPERPERKPLSEVLFFEDLPRAQAAASQSE